MCSPMALEIKGRDTFYYINEQSIFLFYIDEKEVSIEYLRLNTYALNQHKNPFLTIYRKIYKLKSPYLLPFLLEE
jgi:hypothetical protein